MNAQAAFRLWSGIVRQRINNDLSYCYQGCPEWLIRPVSSSITDPVDKLARKQPGGMLQWQKEKRDPLSWRNLRHFNCRCSVVLITLPDPTKSPD